MHCGQDPIGGREQNRQTQTATIQSKSVPCERILLQLEICTWLRPCLHMPIIVVKQILGIIQVCNGNVAGLSLGHSAGPVIAFCQKVSSIVVNTLCKLNYNVS